MPDPTHTTVRIPRTVQEDLKTLAGKHRRSVNAEATFALEKYVEEHRHVLEALKQEATR